MTTSEAKYFGLLKQEISETMQANYPGIPHSVADWKGQNIVDFQSDLQFKLSENISEKWFYTHMKSSNRNLPRIDILNILSRYSGYKNWEEFKAQKALQPGRDKSKQVFYLVPLITVIVLTAFYFITRSYYSNDYTFCFFNNDTKEAITNNLIEISVLNDKESPVSYLCDSSGCFSLKTTKRVIRFVVKTPYFKTDTIVRRLSSFNSQENINLQVDDYALIIHYFSNSNVSDWLRRRDNLDEMISDSAKIFQVMEGTVGMEIYNKWEFINKLTIPTSSLHDIEIIDSQYKDDQITRLRFIQNEGEE